MGWEIPLNSVTFEEIISKRTLKGASLKFRLVSLFSLILVRTSTAMAALRVSYHRILDKIEHMLPAKLRPMYNHPAGNFNCIALYS